MFSCITLTDLIMSVADCADQASVSLLKKVHSLCRLLLSYHNSGLGNGLRQAPYMLFLADVFAQMISIDLIKKLILENLSLLKSTEKLFSYQKFNLFI